MADEEREWICTTVDGHLVGERTAASPTRPLPMGMAAKNNLWKKDTLLRVRFLQGTEALQTRVLNAARHWLQPGVKLAFALAEPGQAAHIRIAFDPGGGSWSYVGTDNLGIHPSQPTMNLGWATLQTPDDKFSSVVIHEWGHALGLLHEHNHPEARIEWNKAGVYADLQGAPNFWSKATIDSNVFAKFDASDVIVTNFDAASVMIYTIPSRWTTNQKSFTPSSRLSAGDAETIKRLYS